MSNVTAQGEIATSRTTLVTRVLIIAQGLLTVGMTMVFLPVGVAAVIANAVLAFVAHGVNRRLLAGFAIAGAIVALIVGLGFLAVAPSGMTQVVQVG